MKYRIKYTILLISILFMHNIYAQNKDVIFKCVDPQGNISYLNVNSAKSGNCSKTALAEIDKSSTVSSDKKYKNASPNTMNFTTNTGMVVKSDEQVLRESKRQLVLKKELNDENEQLEIVKTMLQKVESKDPSQSSELNEMRNTHERNIASLEKELGINKKPSPELMVINTNPIIKNNNTLPLQTTSVNTDKKVVKNVASPLKIVKIDSNIKGISTLPPVKKFIPNDNITSLSAENTINKTPMVNINPKQFLLGK